MIAFSTCAGAKSCPDVCGGVYTGGEFEHCRACVRAFTAHAPLRHALSNIRSVDWTKRAAMGALRRIMSVGATVAQA